MSFLREIPPTAGLPLRLSDFFVQPPALLEEALASHLALPKVQVECSGSAALYITFAYLRSVSARRTVIVPAYTCPLVARVAERAGLKMLACDTEPGSLELDLGHLATLLSEDTLCVIPTHYGGYITDVSRVSAFVKEESPETWIIEDAAQAFGATVGGKPAGTLGDIGFFSFAVGKGMTLYEGGALVARDPQIGEALEKLSAKIVPLDPLFELCRSIQLAGFYLFYRTAPLYFAYGAPLRFHLNRGDAVRAIGDYFDSEIPLHKVSVWRKKTGSNALARLKTHQDASKKRFEALENLLGGAPGLKLLSQPDKSSPTYTFGFVHFDTENACQSALSSLWRAGLGVSKLFVHALGEYDYLEKYLQPTETPNASAFAKQTLTVSLSPFLEERELSHIADTLKSSANK